MCGKPKYQCIHPSCELAVSCTGGHGIEFSRLAQPTATCCCAARHHSAGGDHIAGTPAAPVLRSPVSHPCLTLISLTEPAAMPFTLPPLPWAIVSAPPSKGGPARWIGLHCRLEPVPSRDQQLQVFPPTHWPLAPLPRSRRMPWKPRA